VKILPIAERELRVASRRPGTYWLRFFIVASLMAISGWAVLMTSRLQPQMVGRTVFYTLTGGVMFYAMLAGIRFTSDSLSEEKREGTLGLLFLTDLRGYDVVIGKLLANSLAVFYCVLAVLPVLAIPLLMGGVEVGEFARLVVVIVNSLFFSLCVGMFASAISKSSRMAISWTLLLLLVVCAGSPALGMLEWRLRNWQGSFVPEFLIASPVFSYFAGTDQVFKRGFSNYYFISVGIVHLFAWIFLALASFVVRNSWQDKPETVRSSGLKEKVRDVLEGDASVRYAFRARLLDQNAFYWLATKPRQNAFWSWLPLILAAIGWIWGYAKMRDDWFHPGLFATTMILLGLTTKAMVVAESSRRILQDRIIGSLELLITTPLTVNDIVRGQRLAIQRQFRNPIIVMFAIGFVLWLWGASHHDMSSNERPMWLWAGFLAFIVFFADIAALFWMGMWHGLAVKNTKHAFGSAAVPILVLPWVGLAGVVTASEFLPREFRHTIQNDTVPMILWFVFSLATDLIFGIWARSRLLGNFRDLAAQRFQIRTPWWQRFFGLLRR
jgi:ABC-type transport system involved in multi-copper enzyme maturation permease subunit